MYGEKKETGSARRIVMLATVNTTELLVRTERRFTLAGTRSTLYDLLTYLKADWPPHLVQQWLNLTDVQMQGAMDYIAAHPEHVEKRSVNGLSNGQKATVDIGRNATEKVGVGSLLYTQSSSFFRLT